MEPGTYIVRKSENKPGSFGLTVSHRGQPQHYLVELHQSRQTGRTKFGIQDGLRWEFLAELLDHYHQDQDGLCCQLSKNVMAAAPRGPARLEDVEMQDADLVMGKELGEGEFGVVRLGECVYRGQRVKCAIKVLKSEVITDRQAFLEEGSLQVQLDHPNIVKLLGYVSRPALKLVSELAELGVLNKYLKKNKSQVTLRTQLLYLQQVAEGMTYLESRRVVHRDLAARNILVATMALVKISDFGLSRQAEGDYYQSTRTGKWPIKWYAPECIYFSKFTSLSDVWSFGIAGWEILCYGKKPYRGMNGTQVVKLVITDGGRLPPPPGCPEDVFELMMQCWSEEAADRPRFSTIVARMKRIRAAADEATEDHYQNVSAQNLVSRARTVRANYDPQAFYDVTPTAEELAVERAEEAAGFQDSGGFGGADSSVMLPFAQLRVGDQVGAGTFGEVCKGKWNGKDVAVKTVYTGAEFRSDLLVRQAELMQSVVNPFVVPFLGLSQDASQQIVVVTEFQREGPLDQYLGSRKPPMPAVLKFVTQIATGMAYLEKKRIVHRDLAARNVLVKSRDTCKIGDFNLARSLGHETEYYRAEQRGMWPIKWYAPECLYQSKFSSASDVWSFGVVAWEATTYGAKPYPNKKGREVLSLIESGQRLQVPPAVQSQFPWVQSMLSRCWEKAAARRPKFSELEAVCKSNAPL